MFIQTENTPNPNSLKFLPGRKVSNDGPLEVLNQEDTDNDGEGDACDYNDGIGIDEISEDTQTLIKMIDVLGREQQEHNKGSLLFYIYDNRVVEKKFLH